MVSARKFILVAVDGGPESQIALRWAVDAAAARNRAVRVVYAYLDQAVQWPAIGAEGYIPEPQVDRYQSSSIKVVSSSRTSPPGAAAPQIGSEPTSRSRILAAPSTRFSFRRRKAAR
jgi:nucleotide-binding universal stress UspA family protein